MAGGRRTGTANKTGSAEVQHLPTELALETQVHAPANQTVRQPPSASSALHSYPEARAAVQHAGEPLGALCVAILVLLAWCVTRRRRMRQLGVAELELAAKYRQVPTEEGAGHDAPPRSTSAWVGFGNLCLCRCSRRLRALLERAVVRSPRLSYAVRRWLGAGPKRRDSTFGPTSAYIIEGLSAASLPDVARSTSRASVTFLEGLGRTRQAQPPELCPALSGSTSNPPSVLSRAQLARLAQALPARYAICDWRLVYSTEQHGCSLWTFYSRAERCGPSLLVVLDSGGSIFGAFLSQPWHRSERYFGSGESFLVKVHPHFEVYRWTRQNSLFALAGHDHIAMGGGGGFGLWLDGSFENGSSSRSETFGNEPLASAPHFKCVRIELWAFV